MNLAKGISASNLVKNGFIIELMILTFAVVAFYFNTASDVFRLWNTSETYSHGILMLPMSYFLIWDQCKTFGTPKPKTNPLGLVFILLFSFLWLCGNLVKINLVSHVAMFALLPSIVLYRFGLDILLKFKGPLLFLFFAVPFGDFLIPHLQQVTASISVALVKLVGIPVFNDGLYISIPNANFLVAEACSGIRFLISSFTLGIFYSLLSISNIKKRILFIFLSFTFPIIANGLRVFMIVLIGFYISVEAATGFDHLVYGWIFFSIVLLSLLYIGSRLQDPAPSDTEVTEPVQNYALPTIPNMIILVATLAIAPATFHYLESSSEQQIEPVAETIQRQTIPWAPVFSQPDNFDYQLLTSNQMPVHYFTISYDNEMNDKELITFNNRLFNEEHYSIKQTSTETINVHGIDLDVRRIQIVSLQGIKVNILATYQVADAFHSQVARVKFMQLMAKLSNSDHGGAAHIISGKETEVSLTELKAIFAQQLTNIQRR